MKSRFALFVWLIPVFSLSILFGTAVFITDPFFHYRKPCTERYFYVMDNERSQNDGILKHFDYDALIIGSSMTQNFETSEFDRLFDVHSVKTPFKGASFREIKDNLDTAFSENSELKAVIRALDYVSITSGPASKRENLPSYLYDRNPFNDVKYLLNRDIVFHRALPMITARQRPGFQPGITSFDEYDRFYHPSGLYYATYDGIHPLQPGSPVHLSEEERGKIRENIQRNVISVASSHPDTVFYCYFTPYSAAWWQSIVADGTIYRQLEAERILIELVLECENIRLFSFNMRTDITTDMNNYSDPIHYSEWINSLILKWIHDGNGLLTQENYLEYLDSELEFYLAFDYLSLNDMLDYENDLYAAALLNRELNGAVPVTLAAESFDEDIFSLSTEEGHRYLVFECNASAAASASVSVQSTDRTSLIPSDHYFRTNDRSLVTTFSVMKDVVVAPVVLFPGSFVGHGEEWFQFIIDLSVISVPFDVVFCSDDSSAFRQLILY